MTFCARSYGTRSQWSRYGRAVLVGLCFAGSLTAVRAARAQNSNPKRTVAVLEFRKGSAALQSAADVSASVLRKATSLQVMDAEDARKKYGNHLGRDLFRCQGEARCISRIGRQLGAAEVLLVGISEFGDVILTLQRIGVGNGNVITRIAEALAQNTQPTATAMTRFLKRVMPKSDFIRYGTLRIEANVRDATVYIDKQRRGVTPIEPLRMRAPANYQIRVTKPGYVPFRASIIVSPDSEMKVHPELVTQTAPAWYKRWWVAAIAGTLVVGAITMGVVAAQGPSSDVPVRIPPY